MVYIFGVNVPLVEILFIIAIFILVAMLLIVWALLAMRKMNKKLDAVLREERVVKHELDLALKEENKQIELLAGLMGNVKVMQKISKNKEFKLKQAEKLMAKAGKKNKIKSIKKAIDDLKDVDKLSRKEDKVLNNIGKDIKKYAKVEGKFAKGLLSGLKKILPKSLKKKSKKKIKKKKR
ncbi:hypothetical protein ACFL1H_06950 [Nanoarchaeota archaeon]